MKAFFAIAALAVTLTACTSSKKSTAELTLTGTIQPTGITTYQYGTHTIQADGRTYALRSTVVVLNDYNNKQVVVKGSKIAGYPVEGGPDFIEVSSVTLK
jgi:hypothetical protein